MVLKFAKLNYKESLSTRMVVIMFNKQLVMTKAFSTVYDP